MHGTIMKKKCSIFLL